MSDTVALDDITMNTRTVVYFDSLPHTVHRPDVLPNPSNHTVNNGLIELIIVTI